MGIRIAVPSMSSNWPAFIAEKKRRGHKAEDEGEGDKQIEAGQRPGTASDPLSREPLFVIFEGRFLARNMVVDAAR